MRAIRLLLLLALLPGAAGAVCAADEDPFLIGRVAVKGAAFWRVPGAAAQPTAITRGGRPVPVNRAGAGRDLVFLAHDVATDHSAWAVYEVWGGGTPADTPVLDGGTTVIAPTATRHHAPDRVHGDLAAGRFEVYGAPGLPTWFLGTIPPGKGASLDLSPLRAAPGHPQSLGIEVYASRIGPVALAASWGGKSLGTARAAGAAGGATLTWEVPADAVPAEGTALVLQDVSPPAPPAPPQDVSHGRGTLWIDALTLSGPVEASVGPELAVFDVQAGSALSVSHPPGTERIWSALVGPDGTFLGVPNVVHETGDRATIPIGDVPAGTRLFASTAASAVTPKQPARANPTTALQADAAEHVILAVPELVEASEQLAAYRTASGTPSVVVPIEYVYDAYGHGEHTPAAIRSYVLDVMNAPRSRLRYVVLAGDATMNRTDMAPFTTIPTPMARTIYNGATSADRLYAQPRDGSATGGPSIGRLPFREAAEMKRYVERVIAYETAPPADASRRLMRFVTNEARFGPGIDFLLEKLFTNVVTFNIEPAYDIEVTFASVKSPYLWPPPDFNQKVIDGFNEGCLFFTYVGHGFARGFDQLHAGDQRYPVLHVTDVDDIACRNTPPAVFCLACTTAIFDQPAWDGIGEALLKRPDGPIAYWGATRICHPAANALLGRQIARLMAREGGETRLGRILDRARDECLVPTEKGAMRVMIEQAIRLLAKGADPGRLALEGAWMYTLLGDPALKVAFPARDVTVAAKIDETTRRVDASILASLPDGTMIQCSLEVPRNRRASEPDVLDDPLDPANFAAVRENHRRVNELAFERGEATLLDGAATWSVAIPESFAGDVLVVKAWAIAEGDVHQGAAVLTVPPRQR